MPCPLDISAYVEAVVRGATPHAAGGYSDVFPVKHRTLGLVAVKRPRFTESDKSVKVTPVFGESLLADRQHVQEEMMLQECVLLARLDHPNVLLCIGFCIQFETLCLVSPWAENGTMSSYLKREPNADRHTLVRG